MHSSEAAVRAIGARHTPVGIVRALGCLLVLINAGDWNAEHAVPDLTRTKKRVTRLFGEERVRRIVRDRFPDAYWVDRPRHISGGVVLELCCDVRTFLVVPL